MVRTRIGLLVSALVLTLSLLVAPIPALASRDTYYSKITTSTPLDWCPGNAAICLDDKRIMTLSPTANSVKMECWIDARTNGYSTPRWFYVTVDTGNTGFVKAERVSPQSSVGHCDNNLGVRASLWTTALTQYNKTQPTQASIDTMSNVFGFTNWGSKKDWSGDCLSWATLSWYSVGNRKIARTGNAINVYNTYKSQGKIKTTGVPPRGALVFWNVAAPYGHVAISMGNNWMMSTLGMDGDMKPTTLVHKSHFSNYLGWVMPF